MEVSIVPNHLMNMCNAVSEFDKLREVAIEIKTRQKWRLNYFRLMSKVGEFTGGEQQVLFFKSFTPAVNEFLLLAIKLFYPTVVITILLHNRRVHQKLKVSQQTVRK